jgi:spore coat polysaccharide biosynthesis protein SpsF
MKNPSPTPMKRHSAITVVQARMGSTRLPGKMMEDLAGRPLIWHILQRAKRIDADGPVILATTDRPRDTVLTEEAARLDVPFIRGSETDVLGRYLQALDSHPARWVARICGDSPLFDPDFLSHCLAVAAETGADVVKFGDDRPTLYQGGEVVSARALKFSRQKAPDDPLAFEHVTAWAMRNSEQWPDDLKTTVINPDPRLVRDIKLSIDTPEDLARLRRLYTDLFNGDTIVSLSEAAAWLTEAGWES